MKAGQAMRWRMATAVLAAVLGLAATAPAQDWGPEIRQAMQSAAKTAADQLAATGVARTGGISLLPISGDRDQSLEGLLKNGLTAASLTYVEGRNDPLWNEILKEVEWSERKADMLDPATLVKFGRLQGTRMLLYGKVREATFDGRKAFVEIELHLSDIETKRHLWGTVVAKRHYLPGSVQGLVQLDESARGVLGQAVNSAEAGLKAVGGTARTVVLVPLAGDMDRYVTDLIKAMLTRSGRFTVRELDVATLAEARELLRDQPQGADAVMTGAMRDLSREKLRETLEGTENKTHAEIQLQLVEAAHGDVLWADTLQATVTSTEAKQSKIEEKAVRTLRDRPERLLLFGGIAVGAIILIAIARFFMRPR